MSILKTFLSLPFKIEEVDYSESFLAYYDIFVRNSFGNYFDILKEVSYSPMMAEMLSYMDSKSSAWVLQSTGSKSYPGTLLASLTLHIIFFNCQCS